jgi:hypothetical protein
VVNPNTTKFLEKAKLQVLGLLKTPWLPCIQYTVHLDQPTTLPSILTFGWDNASCVCSHLDLTMWVVYVEMTSQRKLDKQFGWWRRMVKPNIHWIKKFSTWATPKNNTPDRSILLQRALN